MFQQSEVDAELIHRTFHNGCYRQCSCYSSKSEPDRPQNGLNNDEQKKAFGTVLVANLLEAGYRMTALTRSCGYVKDTK